MRAALAITLLSLTLLSGCQERPEVFHVLPAYQRGLLAQAPQPGGMMPDGA